MSGVEPRCGTVRVIAIDGPSGSGKSTLADAVAAALGSPVLRVDALFPGWDGLLEGVRLLREWVLLPLSQGRRAEYRVWDWAAEDWGGTRVLDPAPWLVVEGCGSASGAAGTFAALRVWLHAPEAVRRQRALARDGAAYAPHWERWAAQEEALFRADDTRRRADLVIRT